MALPNVFTSGDVFTAANANLLRSNQYNKTTSTKTANYVLVAADVGTRVLMNAAGSTTITVNTSLFSAGDTLEISNIGAGVCTITSGTCTVTSSSTLALAQYASGTLFFTSASAAIFIASAVTAAAGGYVYITGASFTTATSVSLPNDTFSATYKNYKVIFNYVGSDTTSAQTVRLRASGADITAGNYFNGLGVAGYNGTAYNFGSSSGTSWTLNLISSLQMQQEWLIGRPQETTATSITGNGMATVTGAGNSAAYIGGFYNANTSVDSLSLIIGSGATVTGFYRVYGLADA